jgi:hypothetical protein
MVRLQAARHSPFVIWVALSQKPMHAASVLPPPPGALGACSLGLPGDSARLLEPVALPVANCEGSCGDSGATGGAWGAGAPSCDAGAEGLGDTGLGGGPLVMTPPDAPLPEGLLPGDLVAAVDPPPERPSCAIRGSRRERVCAALSIPPTRRACVLAAARAGQSEVTTTATTQTLRPRHMPPFLLRFRAARGRSFRPFVQAVRPFVQGRSRPPTIAQRAGRKLVRGLARVPGNVPGNVPRPCGERHNSADGFAMNLI